ncbi:MAG: FAD-binding oxidoreductase [Rhodospirillales bacterium]
MERLALPQSLWAATARPAPPTPPLTGEVETEVAVIGGGFTGLSAALHAAEGGAQVVLLEAAEPGFGASGRNGGQVIPGFKLDPEDLVAAFGADLGERMAAYANGTADLVFELIEKHAIDCQASRDGWLQGAHSTKIMPTMEARVRQWQARGAPVTLLDRAETTRLSGATGYVGAYCDPRGGQLNPLGYARGLAAAAIKAGASLHGASPATGLTAEGKRWRVTTPEGSLLAEQVLLCTNAYSDDLWPGLRRSVIPVFSYQVATAPLSDNLRRSIMPEGHALSDTRRLLTYCRLDPDGRLVVGGRGGSRESSNPGDYRGVTAALRRLFPQVGEPNLQFYWGGKVAMTTAHLPHVAELAPGVTAAIGFNGRGVAMASATGREIAGRALGKPMEALPFPQRPVKPIPFHGLRRPVLTALVGWKRLRDLQEVGR